MRKTFCAAVLVVLFIVSAIALCVNAYSSKQNEKTPETVNTVSATKEPLPEEEVALDYVETSMFILGDHVFERREPIVGAMTVRSYSAGETVTVVGETDGWYQLEDGGFIRADLLTDNLDEIVSHFQETYPDIIVTYLSQQKTEYWYFGSLIASGDVVTGDAYESPTPIGLYYITSRQMDVDTYPSDDWFCTFNGQIGYHNAPWRWVFGGEEKEGHRSSCFCLQEQLDR